MRIAHQNAAKPITISNIIGYIYIYIYMYIYIYICKLNLNANWTLRKHIQSRTWCAHKCNIAYTSNFLKAFLAIINL